jgi:hypothetical protein
MTEVCEAIGVTERFAHAAWSTVKENAKFAAYADLSGVIC